MNSEIYLRNISHNYLSLLLSFRPSFTHKFFVYLFVCFVRTGYPFHDTSDTSSSLDLSKTFSLRWSWTKTESNSQSSPLELLSPRFSSSLASNSEEAMMKEMEFIHLLRRQFPTPFCLFIVSWVPRKRYARVTRDDTICSKIAHLAISMEPNPLLEKVSWYCGRSNRNVTETLDVLFCISQAFSGNPNLPLHSIVSNQWRYYTRHTPRCKCLRAMVHESVKRARSFYDLLRQPEFLMKSLFESKEQMFRPTQVGGERGGRNPFYGKHKPSRQCSKICILFWL